MNMFYILYFISLNIFLIFFVKKKTFKNVYFKSLTGLFLIFFMMKISCNILLGIPIESFCFLFSLSISIIVGAFMMRYVKKSVLDNLEKQKTSISRIKRLDFLIDIISLYGFGLIISFLQVSLILDQKI